MINIFVTEKFKSCFLFVLKCLNLKKLKSTTPILTFFAQPGLCSNICAKVSADLSKVYHHQASLSVYPETVLQEAGAPEISVKQENLEHGVWSSPTGSPHGSVDLPGRTKRAGSCVRGKPGSQPLLSF